MATQLDELKTYLDKLNIPYSVSEERNTIEFKFEGDYIEDYATHTLIVKSPNKTFTIYYIPENDYLVDADEYTKEDGSLFALDAWETARWLGGEYLGKDVEEIEKMLESKKDVDMKKSESIEDLRDRSVSSGTLKSEDLIPKFLGVLKTYGKDKYDKYIKENPEVEDWKNLDEETMGWVVDELTDLLNEIAPDGCYFGASDGDGADFGFWSMSNESKKSEAGGNKDIFTLDLTRIDADGDEEGLDDMQAAQTFYDEDDAIKAAKELADSYKDDDGVVQVIVMAGEQEKPNGDIVGDSFDIYWASSSDKQTTADYRKKARYAAFDNKMDYYAKGGKSEAYEDIWRGADVMTHTEACEQLDLPADRLQDFIDEYGENWDEDPDAMNEYVQRVNDFVDSCFDQDFVSINGEEIPLGVSRDPKLLIVLTDDTDYEDEAVELVKKLANGELTGSSDDGDYVAIMDGVNGSPHFDIYSEGGKSEGNDDDKGCKGKDCKDDKTKKNEADATFKVGDFVNYDAESDGKADLVNPMVYAEVSSVNDDGTLDLWVRDLDDGGKEVKGADTQFCDKLDHFAGMTDADHYYTGGRLNLYAGYYEIFITDKKLGKPYVFSGTIDDLGEKDAVDIYYDTISFVDKSLEDECRDWFWYDEDDPEGSKVIDMSDMVNPVESKQTEGLPPKKLGNRLYRSRADLINKMKTLDAVEITTPAQFNDIHSKQWLHTAGYALDTNGNLVGQTYFGDKDGKWYYATTKTFQGDYLPECKEEAKKSESKHGLIMAVTDNGTRKASVAKESEIASVEKEYKAASNKFTEVLPVVYFDDYKSANTAAQDWVRKGVKPAESKKSEKASVMCSICGNPTDDPIWGEGNRAFCKDCYSDGDDFKHGKTKFVVGMMISLDGVKQYIRELKPRTFVGQSVDTGKEFSLPISSLNRASILYDPRNESKKSESLTLKQKELKDMARFGQAEDITTISDEEAKALRKKGIETIGVSRGTYGMNGALLRDNEGKKYVITARSSNLFYFV